MPVRIVQPPELPAIAALINLAFEVEKFFIDGERVNLEQIRRLFSKGCFLAMDADRRLAGCVYVEPRGSSAYLGLLAVDPARHGMGLGRRLVEAAEDYARGNGCDVMELNIVNVREELPPFYRKLGYSEMGTAPFESDTEKLKVPCHFIRMAKPLRPQFQ